MKFPRWINLVIGLSCILFAINNILLQKYGLVFFFSALGIFYIYVYRTKETTEKPKETVERSCPPHPWETKENMLYNIYVYRTKETTEKPKETVERSCPPHTWETKENMLYCTKCKSKM